MPLRSLFFVPGNNIHFIEKARLLNVDILCFDLEDSVPQKEKKTARQLIKNLLKKRYEYSQQIYIRINSPNSDYINDDLNEIIQTQFDGIVIPKVNNVVELKKIEKVVNNLEIEYNLHKIKFIPSIESASGVINSYNIASCTKKIYALIFGIFDLLDDMGINYTKKLNMHYARSKIPIDARAAGVFAIDSIWQDIHDENGLQNDCILGKNLGYSGKSIIHPKQIEIVHTFFKPTKTEIKWAKKVCDIYLKSIKKGKGAITLENKMIDEVHYKNAKTILKLTKEKL